MRALPLPLKLLPSHLRICNDGSVKSWRIVGHCKKKIVKLCPAVNNTRTQLADARGGKIWVFDPELNAVTVLPGVLQKDIEGYQLVGQHASIDDNLLPSARLVRV